MKTLSWGHSVGGWLAAARRMRPKSGNRIWDQRLCKRRTFADEKVILGPTTLGNGGRR